MRVLIQVLLLGLLAGSLAGARAQSKPSPLLADTLAPALHSPVAADTGRVLALLREGFGYQATNLRAAARYGVLALNLSRRLSYRPGEASTLEYLGNVAYYAGNYFAAQLQLERALVLNQELSRFRDRYRNLGGCYLGLGNVNAALYEQRRALANYARAGAAYAALPVPYLEGQLLVLNNSAGLYLELHQPALAARTFRQVLALTRGGAQPRLRVAALRGLGTYQMKQHLPDSAFATLETGLRLAQAIGEQREEAGLRAALSELALGQSRLADAHAHARRAVLLAQQGGHAAERGDALVALAAAQRALRLPEAYDTLRSYLTLHDTLLAHDRTDAIFAGQARFQAAEQQARIVQLEANQRLQAQGVELTSLRYRQQMAGLGALGLLALALLGGAAWRYRRRLAINLATRDVVLRTQLAADLHDDVGSLLTQISLQSDLLRESPAAPAQTLIRLNRLSETSRRAARQMADVVWGLRTASAELPEVLMHMRDHAHEVLPLAGLAVDFAVSDTVQALKPSVAVCQSLYLIYKEALHNVVKHAQGATQVTVRLSTEAGQLCLAMRDDAPGPAAAGRVGGQGLASMRQRAQAVGGTLRVTADAAGFGVMACLPV